MRDEHRPAHRADPLVDRELIVHQPANREEPVAIARHRHRGVERRFKQQRIGLALAGHIGRGARAERPSPDDEREALGPRPIEGRQRVGEDMVLRDLAGRAGKTPVVEGEEAVAGRHERFEPHMLGGKAARIAAVVDDHRLAGGRWGIPAGDCGIVGGRNGDEARIRQRRLAERQQPALRLVLETALQHKERRHAAKVQHDDEREQRDNDAAEQSHHGPPRLSGGKTPAIARPS